METAAGTIEQKAPEQTGFSTAPTGQPNVAEGAAAATAPIVAKTPEQEYWEKEWKNHFPDEDVETVKSYKTKAAEYEGKVKDYEPKLTEYETKLKDLTEKRFANDRIAKLNELAESGEEITEQFVAFLNKDYSKITDPITGLGEALRKEHPDWSEKEIQYEIRQQYNLDKIKPLKDEEGNELELTDEQKELKEISDLKANRDWANKKQALIDEQNKKRIVKPIDPKVAEEAAKQKQAAIDNWNNRFEKVKNNSTIKYEFEKGKGIKINDVDINLDPFEFTPDKEDLQTAHELFNSNSPQSETDFFLKLINKNGGAKSADEADKIVMDAILRMVTDKKRSEKLAAANYQKGYEAGVKQDKNATIQRGGGSSQGGAPVEGFTTRK